jgi:hypothetical protein
MKHKDIFIYSCIMIAFSFFALEVVARALTGSSIIPDTSGWFKSAPRRTVDANFKCSDKPMIKDLDKAKDPQLRKLSQYQQVCNSLVTSHMMVFSDMPKDDAEAAKKAKAMASTLKEFSKYKVTPVVIVEPVASWGDIDFGEFKTGFYNKWLETYFKALKSEGITDQQMGIWVPFPEANLPYWNRNNAKAEDFGDMVNIYLTIAKTSFPKMHASVMLNSATYSADDFDWARGEYISLIPYVKNIKKGLVQSFGLQGFPWAPPANQAGPGIFDASEFLNHKLAQEAADAMGVKEIWFNTGTFGLKYAGDATRAREVDPERRTDVLNGILSQAQTLKEKGYKVSIHLFAEDKGSTTEATDWSYFGNDTVLTSPASPVFANFASRLNQNDIEFWLFDRMH